MIEDGSLWETLHRHVAPDYVIACVQVIYLVKQGSYPGACIPVLTTKRVPRKSRCVFLLNKKLDELSFEADPLPCLHFFCRWIRIGGLARTTKQAS